VCGKRKVARDCGGGGRRLPGTRPVSASVETAFPSPRARVAALAILLLLGLAVRFDALGLPPIDFHPTRQLRSAMIARDFAIACGTIDPTAEEKAATIASRAYFPPLEPPILEAVAAAGYGVLGGERLWLPRALSGIAWMLAGLALYRSLRAAGAGDGALVGLACHALLPFGVAASRSFQPDPTMTALGIASIVLFHASATRNADRFVPACIVAGFAALVKPPAAIFCAAAALWCFQRLRARPGNGGRVAGVALMLLIPGAYYGWMMATAPAFGEQAGGSFRPAFWIAPSFWEGWIQKAATTAGLPMLIVGGVGIAIAPRPARSLLLVLAAGYVAYGLCFSYHIHTHDYYHLPLLPLLAAGAAFAARPVGESLASALATRPQRIAFAAAASAMLLVVAGVQHYRNTVGIATRPARWDFAGEVARARRIGEIVGHGDRVLVLAPDYGATLRYYGNVGAMAWPTTEHAEAEGDAGDFESMRAREFARAKPEFFVATDLADFAEQPELRAWLDEHGRKLEKTGEFVVYDLRE